MNPNHEPPPGPVSSSILPVHLHPVTLAFTGSHRALEEPFRRAYFSDSLQHVRRCIIYAILFFSVFGILDAHVFPEHKYQLWFIRFVLVCPVFLAGLIFSYTDAYRRLWQPINAVYVLITGFAYVAMVVITPAPESYFYGVGTIFCIFFGYTFIHARFITASIGGILVFGGYQAAMIWLVEAAGVIQLIFGSYFLGINLLGMLICYSIETQQRKSFFLIHLLETEKRKTEAVNRTLEKRVEERTLALQHINRDLNKEILERKQAERRVRAGHEQLSSILDSIDADIHVSDLESGVILLANRHMQQSYGAEIVGQPLNPAILGGRDVRRHGRQPGLADETGPSGQSWSWEERDPRSGRWTIVYARAITWENGRIARLQVATDITAMKEMEARLQRAQKMEAIGALAGGVAHDLNNILSGLVGYPELLLMDLPAGSQMRPIVETIKKSGEKAAAIVQDMLTLARRGVAVTDVVNLNRVVQEYLESPELAKLSALHSLVTIHSDLAPDLFNIVGSPLHLGKSVMNLVTNAVEAIPGVGTIHVSTRNCYVDRPLQAFETVPEGEYVQLQVADTGIGIAEPDLERIFEPFYTKKQMGRSGTGLGMAVVWGTVKDHGAFIDARSAEGEGTVFDIYFPVTREDLALETEALPIDRYRGAGETVLVVDDIQEQRDLAQRMLQRLGYQVDTVSNGPEAVAYIRRKPVDLLVLDMIIDPEMDGLDTYRQILAIAPGQKAVIASGFSESERVLEAQRLGAGAYIRKPYRMEEIGMALRAELAGTDHP